jgi:hypothetical protein
MVKGCFWRLFRRPSKLLIAYVDDSTTAHEQLVELYYLETALQALTSMIRLAHPGNAHEPRPTTATRFRVSFLAGLHGKPEGQRRQATTGACHATCQVSRGLAGFAFRGELSQIPARH